MSKVPWEAFLSEETQKSKSKAILYFYPFIIIQRLGLKTKSEQFQQFGTFTLKQGNFGIEKQRIGSQKAQIQNMIAVDFFKPWASRLNSLMFSSSTQGSIIV